MKGKFIILMLLVCHIGHSQISKSLVSDKEKDLSIKLLNTKFKDVDIVNEFEGYQKITDTSFMNSTTYKEYGVKHLKKGEKHILLLLNRIEDENGNRTGISEILNFLQLELSNKEGMVIGYCGDDGKWDTNKIFAVIFDLDLLEKDKKLINTSIRSIWKVNESGFVEEKLDAKFNCFSDTDYLIKLAKL